MPQKLDVVVVPNGPLKVSGVSKMSYCGKPVDKEGTVLLCRCGQSKKAPFCDASHREPAFNGESPAIAQKALVVWEGQRLRTRFNPNTCMHVFYCKPLKQLRERELGGDLEAAQEIAKVIATCPSGALTYEAKGDFEAEPLLARDVEIDIVEGGEVRIQCAFDINAELPQSMHAERATLCRCGSSKNKPWCDGRHKAKKNFL